MGISIGPSEGGHIMKCDAGMWQVNLPEEQFSNHENSIHCFESAEEAVDFAVTWVETHPE